MRLEKHDELEEALEDSVVPVAMPNSPEVVAY